MPVGFFLLYSSIKKKSEVESCPQLLISVGTIQNQNCKKDVTVQIEQHEQM